MHPIVLIAAGGSLGAIARYWLSTVVYQATGGAFPWGTMVINLTGSFIIGFLAELFDAAVIRPEARSFLTIGFLGAYTTFSSYTLETVNLLRDGELRMATVNVIGSNVAGIICVGLGMYTARLALKLIS